MFFLSTTVDKPGCWATRGGNQQRWLKVKLRGKKNRFAVGALGRVMVGGITQIQQVGSHPSYLSQNSLAAHFGLGEARTADQLEVVFPSGKKVQFQDISANQTILAEEP